MNWYLAVLKKYAVFSGRARRKEYWYFFLGNFIIGIVLAVIGFLTGSASVKVGVNILSGILNLAILLPGLGVAVRRLHDTGHSGWYFLMSFIPLVGTIMLIVALASDSHPGTNEYGPYPKTE